MWALLALGVYFKGVCILLKVRIFFGYGTLMKDIVGNNKRKKITF